MAEVNTSNSRVCLAAKQIKYLFAVKLLACALMVSQTVAQAEEILISAAASLSDALTKISVSYHAESGHTVKFNFGPSSGLARQISQGAPADIFFSADLPQMEALDKKELLEPSTSRDLLSNQLVLIVPGDSKVALSSPRDLLKAEVKRIALAEPSSVPVGVYSRQYLADQGIWKNVKSKIVPVQDARAALASVQSANVEAGFVYKTDAAVSRKVKIAYEVPIEKGPKITYPVAVVRNSKYKRVAREFIAYLLTPAAKSVFRTSGFVVLD
jgi:molybdate transport system substrate-binding protein